MKIGLIGACDRNNFGDLLMPIIFENQYKYNNANKNDIEFAYYGQSKSKMDYLKSKNTDALKDCYNNCDIDIIVGGEVLTSNYKLMYFNLQKNSLKILLLRCLNKIFPSFIEKLSRQRLGGKEHKPWILDKEKLNCKKLIYNTVGGYIDTKDLENIKKVDYMSIRNNYDYQNIKEINKNIKLYPDSVISISKIIKEEEIFYNTEKDIKEFTKNKYFIIQIDNRDSKGLIEKIGNQINRICNKYNIDCILLPIGYAQGHEDQKALKRILKYCNNSKVKMPRVTNIYETIYILKNAEVFIGTSLHGIIVSTSYEVPHIVLTDKLKKLLNYIDTWPSTPIKYTKVESIYENFVKIYQNEEVKNNLIQYKEKLIELANENFENINKIINEVYENE